ncbi:TfoX/Sxy family protein [Caballeronia sp. SEWSISQ10-4 2]|uniref:TfoX/Sxy family protein n=1 Tax=Caballeronia sp. SEWSISQ10-4 2 TaxID=2937438 RepID=UPI00264CB543|nr:TfoX/Sxy family protein [Caballeronia sp. SEWSISQ10-4 2]MDN7176861.1 TfoX/Sxy family protein [Caballeronia sp. SEWSISQ10-4 2]
MLDELLSAMRGVTRHTMFGCPARFTDRKMVACVYGDSVAMKLPVSVAASLQSARRARPFQPYDKSTMRAWVQISRTDPQDYRLNQALIQAAADFARLRKADQGVAG